METEYNERIKKEISRIKKLYKNLPKERKAITEKLIERAAYMLVSLEDMERRITHDGLVVEMPQGKYTIERAHPLLMQYNAMVKNYNSTIKQLGESLPPVEVEKAGEALMRFATKTAKAANNA